ncbi:MAG TPA: hypothetical protein EYH09_00270 [Candidatus Nanopusillus sp.]|nr:hypothetical protein [Candidatus Nanopusillus sp.]HIP90221.1 hypothetical protein [Candidatus Nanopusillus sp.]
MNAKQIIGIGLLALLGLLLGYLYISNINNLTIEHKISLSNKSSIIYIVYSPTCPHCEHLLEYISNIETKYPNVTFLKTTNAKEMNECLKEHNISWNFGVPLVVAFTKNKTYVIEGYPDKYQDINGYFLGENFERNACERSNGTAFYKDGKYLFCIFSNGRILGNKYAIEYLAEICSKESCIPKCNLS